MTTELTTTDQNKPATKGPIDMSIGGSGLVPASYSELMQLSALLHASGLAPHTLDTPQKVAVAMAMCLELGRPIITGIQDMAVINGKVGMYGDAILGLIRASGELEAFEQWEEGQPLQDNWVVYTRLKRRGHKEVTGSFSWLEAKRAGYDNPKRRDGNPDTTSPWRRFTRRMMQFKARNFILRDQFGDILRGMKSDDELRDVVDLESHEGGLYSAPVSEPQSVADRARAAAPSGPPGGEPGKPPPCYDGPIQPDPIVPDPPVERSPGGPDEPVTVPSAGSQAGAITSTEPVDPGGQWEYYILEGGKKVAPMVLTEEEVLAKINAMRTPGIEAFVENNDMDAIPPAVSRAASLKLDRLAAEQQPKKEEAPQETPQEAPPLSTDYPAWAMKLQTQLLRLKKEVTEGQLREITTRYGYRQGMQLGPWILSELADEGTRVALLQDLEEAASQQQV